MGTRYTRGQTVRALGCLVQPMGASLRQLRALAKPVAPWGFAILFVVVTVGMVRFLVEERQVMAEVVSSKAKVAASKSAPLAHMVFFTLVEPNDENRAKLVEGCKKFLDGHEGVVYFSVGVRAPEYDREVNDRDYDVALHLVFETAQDQDVYQTHPRHVKFVDECKGLWKQVRVFDSRLK